MFLSIIEKDHHQDLHGLKTLTRVIDGTFTDEFWVASGTSQQITRDQLIRGCEIYGKEESRLVVLNISRYFAWYIRRAFTGAANHKIHWDVMDSEFSRYVPARYKDCIIRKLKAEFPHED